MEQKRIHLFISGGVQGVGYRAWFRREALKSGVSGWVRNRGDKTVEAICEGDIAALKRLIELAKQGPPVAQIDNIDVAWETARGEFIGFEIKLTS